MLRTKIILIAIFAFSGCTNPKSEKDGDSLRAAEEQFVIKTGIIKFAHLSYNYGTISSGEKVTHTFRFTNAGGSPLKITMAQASCGCTVPEFPKKAIYPGKDGVIKVVFNSANKSGMQEAVITITTDGEPTKSFLHLTGNVKVPREIDRGKSAK
ncbi:DUF1573 domain-containing protein [Pedobacter heparinus]|uniref:DUF1573 domain-containing protein n=1 Tax=Pedobacter heparinus TaxID=984 RepID=UPI002930CCFE|nr:DUF1573 domain-containing protein [Pedobacter heparinus]